MKECLLLILFLYSFNWDTQGQDNFTSGGVLRPLQANMNIYYYDIFIDIDLDKKYFRGSTSAFFELKEPSREIELHLVDYFKIKGVYTSGGEKLNFKHQDHIIVITGKDKFSGRTSIQVEYEGNPPEAPNPPWVGGVTWAKDPAGNHWVGVSCPNEGSKVFFPSKDHPSDRADSVALNIRVPDPYFVAANGILEDTSSNDGKTTYHWKTRYPVSNYNINFTIGKLISVERNYTTINGHRMPVIFYVNESDLEKAVKHLDIAVENLSFHEKYFGEYPFYKEKFGLAHTSYLGMEHQTINAYGNHFKYENIRGHEWDWLMLHEMGHEWWANKITLADWADYWIHEGITSYADALYVDDRFGTDAYHAKIAKTAEGIKNTKPIIPKRDANTDEVYQGDIYSKGAYLLHTLRYMMGDESFFIAIKAYASNPGNTYSNFASTDQFISFFSSYTSVEIATYIRMHLTTIDLVHPVVKDQGNGQYEITLGIPFDIPIDVEIDGKLERMLFSRKLVKAKSIPRVDPMNWYLKTK